MSAADTSSYHSSSSSLTRYHFDGTNISDSFTTNDDWQFILQRLKFIVDSFMEERHLHMHTNANVVLSVSSSFRLFATPYSYMADDIIDYRLHNVQEADLRWIGKGINEPTISEAAEAESVSSTDSCWSVYDNQQPIILFLNVPGACELKMLNAYSCMALSELRRGLILHANPLSSLMDLVPVGTSGALLPLVGLPPTGNTASPHHIDPLRPTSDTADSSFTNCYSDLLANIRHSLSAFLDYTGGPLFLAMSASDSDKHRHLWLSNDGDKESRHTPGGEPQGRGLPNEDQLRILQDNLADNMPKLFIKGHDYSVYTNDVVFENNWFSDRTCTTVGKWLYAIEIAKLRLFVHFRLANVRVQLLKTTVHVNDGSVRVRWRVSGIPQSRAIMFWKFLPWSSKHTNKEDEWLDGFSTFSVEQSGLIYKHKMDRIIPNEGHEPNTKPSLIEKLTRVAAPAATT
jgi:hypothetical protein